ncbi:O-antigen ligase family protein [Dokdonella sp.]|uniref:O-antigen ligase family protein n=1 Tax=Dokdonella sp. TaxID=2291710 RepID=UPI0031BDCA3A|nr:O-antigen ligase family protein [Dokdonella sp.]
MILRLLLGVLVVYMVYEARLAIDTGITGLNLANLLMLATVVMMMLHHDPDPPPSPARLRTPLLLWFLALGLGLVIAMTRAPGNTMDDITYLKTAIFSPLLYFVMLRSRLEFRHVRLLIILTLVVAVVGGVQAIRQALDFGITHFQETHRSTGPFGPEISAANRAGVYFAMYLPMFLALALFLRGQRAWRSAAVFGVVVLGLGILFTYSRQSYFIALVAVAVLSLRRNIVFAAILSGVLIFLGGYLPSSVEQRVDKTEQRGPHGGEQFDVSTVSRWEIWAGAMEMWERHPAGVGLHRFPDEIGKYSKWKHMDAHNFYVLTLAEAGLQGLVALLWLLFALFRLAGHLRRSAPQDNAEARALALGFTVATLCMALGNLYGSPFLEGRVMGSYWMLCGLLERYMHLLRGTAVAGAAAATETEAAEPAHAIAPARFPLAERTLPGRVWLRRDPGHE